jgi:hypothetical protein
MWRTVAALQAGCSDNCRRVKLAGITCNNWWEASMTKVLLKIGVLAVVLAIRTTTSADARPGVIRAETFACTSWGAAHEYTLQSLTPKGGQFSKNCPIRLPEGTKIDVVNEDDEGYAVVTHRGKTWWVDGERVR